MLTYLAISAFPSQRIAEPEYVTQDKSRILLVDDYVTLAESIGEVLEMKGFAVKYVSDGDTAILAVEKEAFHAVLTGVTPNAVA